MRVQHLTGNSKLAPDAYLKCILLRYEFAMIFQTSKFDFLFWTLSMDIQQGHAAYLVHESANLLLVR